MHDVRPARLSLGSELMTDTQIWPGASVTIASSEAMIERGEQVFRVLHMMSFMTRIYVKHEAAVALPNHVLMCTTVLD